MKRYICLIFLINVVCVQSVFSLSILKPQEQETISDGPYITVSDDTLEVEWVCQNRAQLKSVNIESLPLSFSECGLQAEINDLDVPEQINSYSGDFTIAALSDAHGQYELLLTLLRNNQIIDANNYWRFDDNHVVITGDVFDRGDKMTEIVWFLYRLEQQAIAAGGNVHLLLGNHEVMVLNNRLKYLHKKYVTVAQILKRPFDEFYTANTVLGKWLRSKNVAVKINDSLFAHGGFHPKLVAEKMSLSMVNNIFKDHLVESELEAPREGMAKFLHKTNGPIWYRGYFREIKATSPEIDRLLAHFEVARIVVGHTSQEQIETRYEGRVIAIDSSMKKGVYGEVLFVDKNQTWRGTLSGEKRALE